MLADAIRAEGFRLSKNRTALFWSVVFVPIMAIVFGALGHFIVRSNQSKIAALQDAPPEVRNLLAGGPLNMAEAMVEVAANLANPAILMFVLIGAAAIHGADYRWETWRLISARNSRPNLLLGKVAVTAGLALMALLVFLVAGLIDNIVRGMVFERPMGFAPTGGLVADFLAITGLSWLRVIQFCMMGLLAAVLTRSLLAALFIPLVIGVGQAVSPQLLLPMGVMPDSWTTILLSPGLGYDAIKAWIAPPPGMPGTGSETALRGAVSLLAWTAAPLAGALALFQRQDLSKE